MSHSSVHIALPDPFS